MIHKTRKHHFNRHDNLGFKNLVSFFVANLAICNDINDVQKVLLQTLCIYLSQVQKVLVILAAIFD